jgi:sepiapterin reductase
LNIISAQQAKLRFIVNVSSLLAIQPSSHWSFYASAKAARESLLMTIAKEEKDVRALNYAPGPLDNDMMQETINTLGNQEQRVFYRQLREQASDI